MSRLLAYLAVLVSAASVTATGVERGNAVEQAPPSQPVMGQSTSQGCFKSNSATFSQLSKDNVFVSVGSCVDLCVKNDKDVAILHLSHCYCADTYPPKASIVNDSECDYACPGYAVDACGGTEAYSVFNTGHNVDVEYDEKAPISTVQSTAIPNTSEPASSSSQSTTESLGDINVSTPIPTPSGPSISTSPNSSTSKPSNSTTETIAETQQPASTASPTTVAHSNTGAARFSNVAIDLFKMVQALFL